MPTTDDTTEALEAEETPAAPRTPRKSLRGPLVLTSGTLAGSIGLFFLAWQNGLVEIPRRGAAATPHDGGLVPDAGERLVTMETNLGQVRDRVEALAAEQTGIKGKVDALVVEQSGVKDRVNTMVVKQAVTETKIDGIG